MYRLSQHTPALLDANKCVELDCNWAKGYLRKGDALYQMKKYTESYNAYNYALRITPNDSSVKDKCELAQKAIRGEVRSSERSSTSPTRPTSTLSTIQSYTRIFLVINAVLYLLPILGQRVGATCYRSFVISALVDFGLSLYTAHGVPKFNMQYAQALLLDPTAM